MCTVTLVPFENNNFVLISNRDEAPSRLSLPPDFYNYKNKQLLYPKDVQSEGTWIGVSENKRLICLLNGGFEIHERASEYRTSRGIVVKDLLVANDIVEVVDQYELNNIEPFTLIIVEWDTQLKSFELVWDGANKHFKALENKPYIWSSSTLYNEAMRSERLKWFNDFKADNNLTPYSMLIFHQVAGEGNKDYGVIMDRGFVKTTSITRIEKENDEVAMRYYDIDANAHSSKCLSEAPITHE